MTIACAWWDESDGLQRITAIADARAAVEKKKNEWEPLSDLTLKLFAIEVRCHELERGLDTCRGGSWTKPYYVTQIGISFAGYCFEALTIIAIISRYLASLATAGAPTKPQPNDIAKFISEIVARYFKTHNQTAHQTVQFLIFGFAPDTNLPWLAELDYRKGAKVKEEFHSTFGKEGELFCIGDLNICHEISGRRILKDIRKHAAGLKEGSGPDGSFEYEVEKARMNIAEKKAVEEMVLEKINSRFTTTVGGNLQKIELHMAEESAVASFTDDRNFDFSECLPFLNNAGLQYVSLGQAMGRTTPG
jgi:hypothetical protein